MKNLLNALILMFAVASTVRAAPISYVYTGTGSGTLNGVSFSNAPFTITGSADTTSVVSCGVGCQFVDHTSASINLNGNTYAMTTGTRTFFAPTFGVGLARATVGGSNLYQMQTGSLSAWDMVSSVGPVNIPGYLLQWANTPQIVTSGGTLIFSTASGISGTFKACLDGCPSAVAPDAPTGVVPTAGAGSASVAFVPPSSNGGAAISSYTVTCTSSDGGATGTASGATSPIVVNPLTAGKTYTCSVTATNSAGTSPASTASSSFVVLAPATPAAIPTLSEWVMLLLAGLIGLFGFARLRRA